MDFFRRFLSKEKQKERESRIFFLGSIQTPQTAWHVSAFDSKKSRMISFTTTYHRSHHTLEVPEEEYAKRLEKSHHLHKHWLNYCRGYHQRLIFEPATSIKLSYPPYHIHPC
jgi:hypothetical protein